MCAIMWGDRYNRSDRRVKSKRLENPGLFRLSTKNLWSVSRNSLLLECGFENFFPFSCKIWYDDRHHPLRTIGNVPFLLTQCGISHQWRTKWIRFQPTAPNEYWSKRNVKQQTFFNAKYISSVVFQNCLKKYFKSFKKYFKDCKKLVVEWCLRSHQVPISLLNVPLRRLDATKNCFKVCAYQKYGK